MTSKAESTNSSTSQSVEFGQGFVEQVVRFLAHHKHIWTEEQQTGHRVCAWCNACDERTCDHYWETRP